MNDLAQGIITEAVSFFPQREGIATFSTAYPVLVFLLMLAVRTTHDGKSIFTLILAVSYTHLDVYKRQK